MPILAALMPLLSKVLDFIPDPAQRAAQMTELVNALQAWDAQQNQVNAAEAANSNVFVSGWRPAIGWVCALALFYTYIIVPFAGWGFAAAHVVIPAFPTLDNNLWQLMFGMIGMGGLRTLEKVKGVAK